MAGRVRAFDWTRTPLGPIAGWSGSLLATVNLVLACRFPCQLWWGGDFIQFHNDAAIPVIASRHPGALGRPAEEVWADAWPAVGAQIRAVYERGESLFHENMLVPIERDGQLADTYWIYGYSPAFEDGRVAGVLDIFGDTTAAVTAARDRDALSERLNEVLAVTNDGVLSLDREWRITYMNQQAKAVTAAQGDVMGANLWEAFPAQIYPDSPYVANYERAMAGEEVEPFEAYYPQPLNLWVQVHPRGTPDGLVLFFRDVTAQKTADISLQLTADALRESEEELRYTVELSAQIPWTAGTDGKILDFGARWMTLTGLSREQARGPGWMAVQHPEDRPKLVQMWKDTRAGAAYDVEHRIRTATGEYRWMRSRAYPRRNAGGEIIKWYGTTEDIDDRKRAEETLLTTEKLAAVGRLAASIAHEINNPLESVTNLLYLARTSEGLSGELQGYLDMAERELRRVSAISNQTLRFHKQATNPQPIYCQDLIGSVLSMQQGRLVNSSVVVEKRKRANQPLVCFEGEIRQVLNNLIGNAIDAMHPNGGRLLVRSREQTDWSTGAPGLVLTVADTGPGISPEVARRIFEPFFTTKGIGGTGLGLWVSAEIVERHQGRLRMRSEVGHGTVFSLFLPFAAVVR